MLKQLLFITLLALGINQAGAAQNNTLDGLLQEVRRFSAEDQQLNREREARFGSDLKQQQQLLEASRDRLARAEQEQERLKAAFDDNDLKLAEMETLIQQRAGQLGEVFGVAKEKGAELKPLLQDALTSADHPGRAEALAFSVSNRVPTLKELEALWYQLQQEMTASGRISRFEAPVVSVDGQTENGQVLRFGQFAAATAAGEYLYWDRQQQALTVLPTQPDNAGAQLKAYLNGQDNQVSVDPTRGQLFMLLDRAPKLMERIHQGGEVGYLIIGLGALGLLVALLRMLKLMFSELAVRRQLARPDRLSPRNPLGRVLLAIEQEDLSAQQRELKVDEAILQELPSIERGQSFVKLLAAVAPLLGLLGTVIGMIATFQSITLFGTSDPKLMAGGISQALMTTVMGLVAAIPLLFCHSYLAGRGRRLTQILQEKSLGLLAERQNATGEGLDRAA